MIKRPSRPPHSQPPASISSSQQFNATPRFSFASGKKSTVASAFHLDAAQGLNQYATSARKAPRQQDVIEDDPDEAHHDTNDINDLFESVGVKLHHECLSADEEGDYDLISPRPKRRRLSRSPNLDFQSEDIAQELSTTHDETYPNEQEEFEDPGLSSTHTIASPLAETHHLHYHRPPTAPRFLLHNAAIPAPVTLSSIPPSTPAIAATNIGAGTSSSTTPFVKPPRFRPPDNASETTQPAEPLPDAFSPQRRGQKFLAGGLAAEVIGWVMNLEGNISGPESNTVRTPRARGGGGEWVVKMVVDEVRGGAGMTLVKGRQVHQLNNAAPLDEGTGGSRPDSAGGGSKLESRGGGGSGPGEVIDRLGVMKVILAGSGIAEAFQRGSIVEAGKMVGIKQPVWEINLEGDRWGVAVTWEVMG
jgi:hypothetical protein